ncbi:hypothetical protein CDD83_3623 [Cordyceps sp. RAO-2017]|nr:hypothetical protein CDD83_3623 [Cordyceps sp. RAO-2017]
MAARAPALGAWILASVLPPGAGPSHESQSPGGERLGIGPVPEPGWPDHSTAPLVTGPRPLALAPFFCSEGGRKRLEANGESRCFADEVEYEDALVGRPDVSPRPGWLDLRVPGKQRSMNADSEGGRSPSASRASSSTA